MPKKFQGMNSKAVEAKARKAAAAAAALEAKKKVQEDDYWKDDDKHAKKKMLRKQAQEQKRVNNINRKKELGDLFKAEEESLAKLTKSSKNSIKVTRASIDAAKRKELELKNSKIEEENLKKRNISVQNEKVEENANIVFAESRFEGEVEARSVEDAISALSTSEELDRHPERRLKAAFKKYEQNEMPALKAAYPGLRMSQLKDLLFKQWQKSPENPLNQKHVNFNAK